MTRKMAFELSSKSEVTKTIPRTMSEGWSRWMIKWSRKSEGSTRAGSGSTARSTSTIRKSGRWKSRSSDQSYHLTFHCEKTSKSTQKAICKLPRSKSLRSRIYRGETENWGRSIGRHTQNWRRSRICRGKSVRDWSIEDSNSVILPSVDIEYKYFVTVFYCHFLYYFLYEYCCWIIDFLEKIKNGQD